MTQEKTNKEAPQEPEQHGEEPKDLTPTGDDIKKVADEAIDAIDEVLKEEENPLDDLMKEVDEVLEQNAEEFVKNYVQRGGE